jgi:NAD(P)-dependent dehydrogenase (short-subunit alcohol dehydrogenase family)
MGPEFVAGVVAWLASDDARFLTSAQIPIDFGNIAR